MNYYIRNGKIAFLNDLQISAGKSEGLTPLTDEQLERHLSSDYEFNGSDFVEVDKSITNEEIEALRSQAYADPLTGSDRLLNDYQASLALGSDDSEGKKEAWLAKREEIKAEYPLND